VKFRGAGKKSRVPSQIEQGIAYYLDVIERLEPVMEAIADKNIPADLRDLLLRSAKTRRARAAQEYSCQQLGTVI
jgi:hypothetical protein